MADVKKILKVIWRSLGTVIIIVGAVLAAFGILTIKRKFQQNKEDDNKVKPGEIKPGTVVVKPGEIKDESKNPFDDKYKAVVTNPDGSKDEIETPIPDDKIDEIVKNDMEVTDFDPEHEKTVDNLLDLIKKNKAALEARRQG